MSDSFYIHRYIFDPVIRATFERAERDLPPACPVERDPRPVLTGGEVV